MMDQAIRDFNKQFEYEPELINGPVKVAGKIIVAGMGGSHLAADLILTDDPNFDLLVHKNYGLPPVSEEVLKNSLLIASSYSGNTEEVVDFLNKAIEKNLNVACVATGGKLIDIAKKKNIPYVQMPTTGIQPRSALGFSLKALLKVMGMEELLDQTKDLVRLDPGSFEEAGKKIAENIKGKIPVVYSSTKDLAIAYNWKIKFNETGKIPAFYNVFPELNHNEMTGFDTKVAQTGLPEKFYFIFLKDDDDHSRVKRRMEVLEGLFKDRNLPVEALEFKGSTRFEKIFSSLILADWAAFHTAVLNNTDPEQVPMVEEFKKLV